MRRSLLTGGIAALACAVTGVWAQDASFPSKPLRFIVPASPGGPSDVVARIFAEKLGQAMGQTVIVENKPGASLTIGTVAVVQAPADGYTLLFTTSTPIVMVPFTKKNVPYDVQKDLVTVSHLGSTPLVLYVNATSAIQNIKQLVDDARTKQDKATFGSYGNGSSAHVLGEILNKQTGLKMTHVPYKGVAPELQDLIAGNIMTAVADVGTALPLVKGGRIRPIAVTGTTRSTVLPDVATFAEQGVSGMEPFSPWWGLFAPAQTPKAIVDRLSAEMAKIVRQPDVSARLQGFGIDATGTTSAQGNEITRTDMVRWQNLIREVSYINFE